MTSGPNERACGGDVAAYALGALDPAEAEAFASHLEACAVCRDELAAFRQVVDVLPMSAPQYPAPRRLRRRVLGAVHDDARLAQRAQRPRRRWTTAEWLSIRRPAVALGALVAVVAVTIAGLELGSSAGSKTHVYAAQVTGVRGSAEVTVTGGHAQLIVRHFSPPPTGKIYEVWVARGGQPPTPTGALFSVTASGNSDVAVPGSIRGVDVVLVTPEPAGGTRVPTHAPVISAEVG